MRILIASMIASMLLAAACGPAPKPESPIVENAPMPEACCCKSVPIASADGLPLYEPGTNPMECSQKQGTCVDEVQCQGKAEEAGTESGLSPDSSSVPEPPSE